jgi:type I restriction enzyme S subunit
MRLETSPMNADRLLALFEPISEAPDAIPRLRRFILDLAVRGKLVEQDPEDEPAEELLKQIALQRKILIADGQLRKDRNEPSIPESTPYALPPGWRWIPFGVMHWLTRGVTYTKSDVSELPEDGYIPLLRANNIGEKLSLDNPVYVRSGCVGDEQYLRSGDFLIALSSGSKHLVGKAVLVPEVSVFAFGGFCGVIRIFDKECTGFTKVFLKSGLYRESVASGSRGIGINNLKKEVLSNAFFPLPPLAEQHRIVAKVDELMALCDQLEAARTQRMQCRERLVAASLQRLNQPSDDSEAFPSDARFALQVLPSLTTTPAQIKQLRQTILNLAVRGKLVEQDPEDEPAEELLGSICESIVLSGNGKRKGTKPMTEPDDVEPFEIPYSWAWVSLGQITDLITSGSRDWAKHYSNDGAIFVRMGNLSRHHYRLRLQSIQHVSPPAGGEGTRTSLQAWDVLVSITGDVGMLGLIPEGFGEAYINQHTALVRPCSIMKGRFLPEVLRSDFAQDQFSTPQRGIKNSFRLSDVSNVLIPLPEVVWLFWTGPIVNL